MLLSAPSFLRGCLIAVLFLCATAAFADSFVLLGTALGAPNIEVSVELNPQPLPPRTLPTALDLFDPMNPKLVNQLDTTGWIMGIGIVEIPRLGQEVIVNFLEGDPDRPIVTGAEWNAVDPLGNAFQVLWTDFPNVAPDTWVGVRPQDLPQGSVGATFQVCQACDPIMGFEVFLLDPAGNPTMYTFQQVPEPGTLGFMASGFLMLAGWHRRRL